MNIVNLLTYLHNFLSHTHADEVIEWRDQERSSSDESQRKVIEKRSRIIVNIGEKDPG